MATSADKFILCDSGSVVTEIVQEWDGKKRRDIIREYEDEAAVAEQARAYRQHEQYGSKVGSSRLVFLCPSSRRARWLRDWQKNWSDVVTWQHYQDWQMARPENEAFRVHPSRNRVPEMERLSAMVEASRAR